MILGSKAKLYVIGALLVVLGFLFWQWRGEIQNAAQWAVGFDQLQATVERQEERLAEEREYRRQIEREMSRHADTIEEINERERERAHTLRRLEETDEVVREWVDGRLPDAIIERLRRASGAERGDGDGD